MTAVVAPSPRPPELEDWLNKYLFHPLARRLARALRPAGISPNAVSVASIACMAAASGAYVGLPWPESVLLGFGLHALWHIIDGADGDLARLTGTASPTGELVDGVCDYLGQIILYVTLVVTYDNVFGGWVWGLGAAAGVSHVVQMNHAESQRRYYLWWAYGVPWLKNAQAAGDKVFRKNDWFSFTFGWMARDYIRLSRAMTPHAAEVDARIDALTHDTKRTERARIVARDACRPALPFQKLLGHNPRTLLLGGSMLLGSPLWYFLAECTVMNLLLVASVRRHNACALGLANTIDLLPRHDD